MISRAASVLWFLLLGGCSESSPSATDAGGDARPRPPVVMVTPDPDQGMTFTQKVTRSAGGTLRTASQGATLTVPPSALAADRDLTVSVTAATADTASAIYNFGPDGTFFRSPAVLRIQGPSTVPAGFRPVLAFQSGGRWNPILGSRVDGQFVTAEVRHFTPYAVVLEPTVAPGATARARVGFYNYNAIAGSNLQVDFYVDTGSGPQLLAENVAPWAGARFVDVPTTATGTLFVTPTGAGATGMRLWSRTDVDLREGTLYHVIYRMHDPDTQEATADIEQDDLAFLASQTQPILRVRFVTDNAPDTPSGSIGIWDMSQTPPSGPDPVIFDQNIDVTEPQETAVLGFGEVGETQPQVCFRFELAQYVQNAPERVVWLFVGSDPENASASDVAANVDNLRGMPAKVDPIPCP